MAAIESFYEKVRLIHDLMEAQQNLDWDMQVMMPHKGAAQRANQASALAGQVHLLATDPALGEAIAALESDSSLDSAARADVREARRAFDREVKLPARLVTERAQAVALAQGAWEEARPKNDFAAFLPYLEKVVALTREMADRLKKTSAYDALLDEYEPGMTEAGLRRIFADLKGRLLPLLDAVKGAPRRPDDSILHRDYPIEKQRAFCRRMAGDMGFDLDAGRLDESAHPFTNGTFHDVRLTTRYMENFIQAALFGAMHEAGHGIYEQGLSPERFRDPAGQACSLGIHESQSRFWENIIGRSRPFWEFYFKPLKETFPGALGGESVEAFYGAVNSVEPSLIRVEADEATYNLHILVRFDIESGLLAGDVQPKELPELWNAKMKEYLGIVPPDDAHGCLQDIHWSGGSIGYFATYALGSILSVQLFEQAARDIPSLSSQIEHGEFGGLLNWLRKNLHQHGRKFTLDELARRITGEPLTTKPYLGYLKKKFGEIYGV